MSKPAFLFPCRVLLTALLTPALVGAAAGGVNTPARAARQVDVAARIRRVEDGLLPPAVIKGRPLPRMRIADRMKYHQIPGVSIAVIDNYKVAWARGYGVREAATNEAVTPDTLFQAGSVSKVVASVAALRLVQQGKLHLDEDVNRKLVSWKIPENEYTKNEKVTLRRILTHTAGLTGTGSGDYRAGGQVPTLLQVLDGESPATTPPVRVIFVPGSRQLYTGSGFFVLQQLLQDVTGKPFPRLAAEMVFRPLRMGSSTFEQPLPPTLQSKAASGHYPGEQVVEGRWYVKPEMAAAGLWATASDLARLLIELQKSRLGKSNKILSKETTNLMLSSGHQQVSGGEGVLVEERGLGVELKAGRDFVRFGHGGRTTGYNCQAIGFDDGRGVVVMTNGDKPGLVREIVRAVAREYGWPEYLPRERTVVTLEPRLLGAYAGEYEFPEGRNPRVSVVTVKDGQLHLDGVPLQAESPTSFFGVGEATLTFNSDEGGRVREMVYDVGPLKLTARKIK